MAFRHLLGIADLSAEDAVRILDTAQSLEGERKAVSLRGKTVVNLFFEASTRTRTSFEIAGKRLSADVINVSSSGSSVTKGETLLDTTRNLDAMHADVVVVRHSSSGAPHFVAKHTRGAVVNAGDGMHEHPTQALLDAYTIRKHKGRIAGLTVAIVGDIAHSRVARSNIFGLTTMGASVMVAGPGTMCRSDLDSLPVERVHSIDEVLPKADVLMMLRIQRERLGPAVLPSVREYATFYGLDLERLQRARPEVIVMHPGPINRGVEIGADVADGDRSVILDQVTNGIAVRMALLFLLLGRGEDAPTA